MIDPSQLFISSHGAPIVPAPIVAMWLDEETLERRRLSFTPNNGCDNRNNCRNSENTGNCFNQTQCGGTGSNTGNCSNLGACESTPPIE